MTRTKNGIEVIELPRSGVEPEWFEDHWRIDWDGGSCLQLFPPSFGYKRWAFCNGLCKFMGTRKQCVRLMDEMVLRIRAACSPPLVNEEGRCGVCQNTLSADYLSEHHLCMQVMLAERQTKRLRRTLRVVQRVLRSEPEAAGRVVRGDGRGRYDSLKSLVNEALRLSTRK